MESFFVKVALFFKKKRKTIKKFAATDFFNIITQQSHDFVITQQILFIAYGAS